MTPGSLRLRLEIRHGRVDAVAIADQRPLAAASLHGRPADDAVGLVPLLFSVCGKAQACAAVLAVAAAQGVETAPRLDPVVEREVMREHLWRWWLDLPPLLGLAPRQDLFVAGTRALAEGPSALSGLLGDPGWGEVLQALHEIEEPAGEAATSLLPTFTAAGSLLPWPRLDDAFARRPCWEGEAAETGAFARWQGQNPGGGGPLAARWLARSAEIWSWSMGDAKVGAGGTVSAVPVAPKCGRALVETARGLLMHEVTLEDDGRIADYVIVAPTEWNFHPHGTLTDWLHGRRHDAGLPALAARAVATLDPCVPCAVQVMDATGEERAER